MLFSSLLKAVVFKDFQQLPGGQNWKWWHDLHREVYELNDHLARRRHSAP